MWWIPLAMAGANILASLYSDQQKKKANAAETKRMSELNANLSPFGAWHGIATQQTPYQSVDVTGNAIGRGIAGFQQGMNINYNNKLGDMMDKQVELMAAQQANQQQAEASPPPSYSRPGYGAPVNPWVYQQPVPPRNY